MQNYLHKGSWPIVLIVSMLSIGLFVKLSPQEVPLNFYRAYKAKALVYLSNYLHKRSPSISIELIKLKHWSICQIISTKGHARLFYAKLSPQEVPLDK